MPLSRERLPKGKLQMKGATLHNLQNLDVKIPLCNMVAIAGVSGSGKSSLILDTLYPALSNKLHKTRFFNLLLSISVEITLLLGSVPSPGVPGIVTVGVFLGVGL